MMEEKPVKEGKFSRLFDDTVLFGLSGFASRVLLLLLTPLYTSLLSEAEYGTADLLMTTIQFLCPVLTLAMADAALRFSMEREVRRDCVLGNALLLTCLGSLLLCFTRPLLSAIYPSLTDYFGIFLLLFFLFNLHNTVSVFLKGIGMRRLFAIQAIFQTVSIIAANLLFLCGFNMGLSGYLYSLAAGYIFPILFMFFGGRLWQYLAPPSFNRGLFSSMLRYSLPMIPAILAWEMNSHIDRYMITGFLGLDANGLYSVAHKIPTILTAVLSVFLQAWQLSAIENRGTQGENDYHTTVYVGFETVSLLACAFLSICCRPIARLLFAGDFYIAWQYVPLLLLSGMFATLSGFLAAAFRAAKKTWLLSFSVLFGGGINILLNLLLIPRMGLFGAALATAFSFFAVWFLRLLTVQKVVHLRLSLWRTVGAYLALFAAVGMLHTHLAYAPLYAAALTVVLALFRLPEITDLCRAGLSLFKKGK